MNKCAKLEPDPGSPSHRGFTPGAACPPGTRAPTRRGSGTGAGPAKPHLIGRSRRVPPTSPRAARTSPHAYLREPAPGAWLAGSAAPAAPHSTRLRAPPLAPSGARRAPSPGLRAPPTSSRPSPHQSTAPSRPPAPPKIGVGLLLTQLRPRHSRGLGTLVDPLAACFTEGCK